MPSATEGNLSLGKGKTPLVLTQLCIDPSSEEELHIGYFQCPKGIRKCLDLLCKTWLVLDPFMNSMQSQALHVRSYGIVMDKAMLHLSSPKLSGSQPAMHLSSSTVKSLLLVKYSRAKISVVGCQRSQSKLRFNLSLSLHIQTSPWPRYLQFSIGPSKIR
ncbi:hypothetical protein VNO77_23163 [Canavalia gladiata]|uniref:Uncharacterized protein n=1 Tax=Canavalia gladiata TaxID=3824 RepID=A0AAN9L971_CANGL